MSVINWFCRKGSVLAHLEGNGTGADVVPLALARLEKMIESRLGEVSGEEFEPHVKVKVIEQKGADDGELSLEPEFYEGIVERIMESLSQAIDEDANELPEGVIPLRKAPDAPPTRCDFFVGKLRCQCCGRVSSDASTFCETFIRSEPMGEELRVGDWIGPVLLKARPDYYAPTRATTSASTHVLEGWECPQCQQVNWAEVVIRDEHVASIWSVELNRASLERANMISSECVDVAARLTGRAPWALLDEDILQILIDSL